MKKISKKDLTLNRVVIASLSKEELLKATGGQKVTGEFTAIESICLCDSFRENACASSDFNCKTDTCYNRSLDCVGTVTIGCGRPPRLTAACTGNGCAIISDGCANISDVCANVPNTTDLIGSDNSCVVQTGIENCGAL